MRLKTESVHKRDHHTEGLVHARVLDAVGMPGVPMRFVWRVAIVATSLCGGLLVRIQWRVVCNVPVACPLRG
jgi:hypothetical protein